MDPDTGLDESVNGEWIEKVHRAFAYRSRYALGKFHDMRMASPAGPLAIFVIYGTQLSASLPYSIERFSQDVVVGVRISVNWCFGNNQNITPNWRAGPALITHIK